jgi:hypothetical protein
MQFCSVIVQLSESRRIRNHTLLSHLRLPKPGGPGSRIYIPLEHGGPVIPPVTGFPLLRLLRLSGLQWNFWEEIIVYFLQYDTNHRENEAYNNYFVVVCVLVAAETFLSSRFLATLGLIRGIYEVCS